MFTDWLASVKQFAMSEALSGKHVNGWKLVEGRSARVIKDEQEALKRLTDAGFDREALTNTKIKGIGDLERTVGKKPLAVLLDGVIVKPQGAPTLAPENDKREPIQPTLDMFEELNS
jgi:hypothetical protein